jgi:hypothetical protein
MRTLIPLVLLALAQTGCGSEEDDAGSKPSNGGTGGTGATGGGSGGTSSGTGGSQSGSGGSQSGSGGSQGGSGNSKSYPPGPPGCGLEAAAFCDTFDAPAGGATRAGELDGTKWSAARMCEIGGPSANDGEAVPIGAATVPTCRDDLPAQVFPSADTIVCDGNDAVQSNHLLMLVAAQNYGQNSYRIRQPFDFAGRTGNIVFDAEGFNEGLLGWISLEITEDPAPAPSFTFAENFENGSIPRNAVEIQFGDSCGGTGVGITDLIVYDDFVQNGVLSQPGMCADAREGRLNRFRVELSQTRVEVFAAAASADGVTFGALERIGSVAIDLPFTRGYVHITAHNHATLKYSTDGMDAWKARWDNVGFDGPAITGDWREYEALDSLDRTPGGKVNVGWRLADQAQGPAQTITILGVDPSGATRARLALQNWSQHFAGNEPDADFALNYRLNGQAWKARNLTASELQMMRDLPNAGTRSLMLDVDVAELVEGDNTLELTTSNAAMSAAPVALNVDLILEIGN